MKTKRTFAAYLVSAPSLTLIFLIVVFPILYTGYISFTNMNTYHWFSFDWIGLRNYARALTVFDSGFLSALWLTVVWTAVNMALQLVIAFALANLLNIKKLMADYGMPFDPAVWPPEGTSSAYTTLQYDRRWLAVGLGGTAAVLAVCLWVQRRPQAGKKERRAHHG